MQGSYRSRRDVPRRSRLGVGTDTFLDLSKDLLVRRLEAPASRDVGGQGLHRLPRLRALGLVGGIPRIDLP